MSFFNDVKIDGLAAYYAVKKHKSAPPPGVGGKTVIGGVTIRRLAGHGPTEVDLTLHLRLDGSTRPIPPFKTVCHFPGDGSMYVGGSQWNTMGPHIVGIEVSPERHSLSRNQLRRSDYDIDYHDRGQGWTTPFITFHGGYDAAVIEHSHTTQNGEILKGFAMHISNGEEFAALGPDTQNFRVHSVFGANVQI